jgi:hypothetical protein
MFNLSLTAEQAIFASEVHIMKKLFTVLFASCLALFSYAQNSKNVNLGKRSADHIMLQLGGNFWTGAPDSITRFTKRINRSVGIYGMLDKQFKSNPKFSVAFGLGVGVSNMYFNRMDVKLDAIGGKLPFVRTDTGNNYKRYKLATAYLEIPVELRYMFNPENPNKSWKIAIGAKAGTLINAHTRGKIFQNAAGAAFNKNTYKVNSKTYLNTTRLAATFRVSYGLYSVFGSYAFTNVFKSGVAADIKAGQVGIAISGL